jgi:hypothetical protein
MNGVERRIWRLENQMMSAQKPRPRFRLIVSGYTGSFGLDHATCKRSLWPNGTIFEHINLIQCAHKKISDEELNRWVESFPIAGFEPRILGS